MATTKKLEEIAALRLELGKLIGDTAWTYNGSTLISLGAGHAFPYTNISINGKNDVIEDDSIDGVAQKDVPIQSAIKCPLESLDGNARYVGMDRLLYWMFGYEDGGSSPQSLGGGLYSHLFELDKYERHLAAYRTAEQTAGDYASTDRKNRFAMLGIKKGTNDYRFSFLLCSGFGFQSSAGGPLKWNAKGQALKEQRGDYSSANWTFPAGMAGSANMIAHHHLTLSMGPPGALVALAVTDFSAAVEIPLQIEQDSESGLYIAQPVLNGKYGLTVSCTLSRHAVDTYKQYRDAFTACCMKAVYATGDYEFGLYFPDMRIVDAPDTGDAVPRHPLTFTNSKQPAGGNPFSTEIGSHDLIQTGEMFCLVKNDNATNEMRRE